MKFGIVPAHGPDHLEAAFEHVQLSVEYGFDSVWIEEHHAEGPYWPTPLLAAAALAPRLNGLIIGTDVLLLPFHDPLRVAEEIAILDRLTSGRFVLGVGLGDSSAELAAFRVPAKRRGARFEEQVAILRGLWLGESLTFHGDFYDLDHVTLGSLPMQPGGPPIWIGGWGPRQLARAATIGDAWFPGPVGTMTEVRELQAKYDAHLVDAGRDPYARSRPITRDVLIAETDERAWQLAENSVLLSYRKLYVESEHPLIGQASGTTFRDSGDLVRDRLIVGGPDAVLAGLARCIESITSDHLILRLKLPGIDPGQMTEMLHLIGREVLPRLRMACTSAASLNELASRPGN